MSSSKNTPQPLLLDRDGSSLGSGRYRVENVLGAGGTGVVHVGARVFQLGVHGERTRPCAIKLMHTSRAHDEQAAHSFIDEGLRGYDLSTHPNLVATRDLGVTADGRVFLVMELAGRSVDQLARRLAGDAVVIRAIADAVLGALCHLHARGVVHRDVTSSNVQIADDGAIKLIDLGRCRPISAQPGLRPHDDLRRLGLMLIELFTGRIPLDGDGRVQSLPGDTPADLRALIQRLLSRTPTDGEHELSAAELRTLLHAGNTGIIDARGVAARLDSGHGSNSQDNDRHKSTDHDYDASVTARHLMTAAASAVETRATAALPPVPLPHSSAPPSRRRLSTLLAGAVLLCVAVTALGNAATAVYLDGRLQARLDEHLEARESRTPSTAPASSTPSAQTPAEQSDDPPADSSTPVSGTYQNVRDRARRAPAIEATGINEQPTTNIRDKTEHHANLQRAEPRTSSTLERTTKKTVATQHHLARFASNPQGFTLGRYGDHVTDVQVTADSGAWLDGGDAHITLFISNRSDTPYRLARAYLQRIDGTKVPAYPTKFEPLYDNHGYLAFIPEGRGSMGTLRVSGASALSGQLITLVLSEPGGQRQISIVGIPWP